MKDFADISCKITFNRGPKIEIFDNHSPIYLIEFYEKFGEDWALIYSDHNFKPYHWFKHNKAFRSHWKIKIWGMKDELPILLAQHTYNEKNKNVLLRFEFPSYKVQKNWFEKSITYQQESGCNLFVESRYHEELRRDFNTNVIVVKPFSDYDSFINQYNIYASYEISRHEIQSSAFDWWESGAIFENHAHHYKSFDHPNDWIKLPNEELIDDILGL